VEAVLAFLTKNGLMPKAAAGTAQQQSSRQRRLLQNGLEHPRVDPAVDPYADVVGLRRAAAVRARGKFVSLADLAESAWSSES
jgi:hypothetical protein